MSLSFCVFRERRLSGVTGCAAFRCSAKRICASCALPRGSLQVTPGDARPRSIAWRPGAYPRCSYPGAHRPFPGWAVVSEAAVHAYGRVLENVRFQFARVGGREGPWGHTGSASASARHGRSVSPHPPAARARVPVAPRPCKHFI